MEINSKISLIDLKDFVISLPTQYIMPAVYVETMKQF